MDAFDRQPFLDIGICTQLSLDMDRLVFFPPPCRERRIISLLHSQSATLPGPILERRDLVGMSGFLECGTLLFLIKKMWNKQTKKNLLFDFCRDLKVASSKLKRDKISGRIINSCTDSFVIKCSMKNKKLRFLIEIVAFGTQGCAQDSCTRLAQKGNKQFPKSPKVLKNFKASTFPFFYFQNS